MNVYVPKAKTRKAHQHLLASVCIKILTTITPLSQLPRTRLLQNLKTLFNCFLFFLLNYIRFENNSCYLLFILVSQPKFTSNEVNNTYKNV